MLWQKVLKVTEQWWFLPLILRSLCLVSTCSVIFIFWQYYENWRFRFLIEFFLGFLIYINLAQNVEKTAFQINSKRIGASEKEAEETWPWSIASMWKNQDINIGTLTLQKVISTSIVYCLLVVYIQYTVSSIRVLNS